MQKRWVFEEGFDPEVVANLQAELAVSESLATLLVQRGIHTKTEALSFFKPKIQDLHDPFLMKDMMEAVERLNLAISNSEKVLVYGDYDVDGTTSVATFFGFLSKYHQHMNYYIPDRYKEGYGLSAQGVDYAAENGYSLIVTLDCGIKANERVIEANKKGIDIIICDHHTPGEELPPALAVLDPKRKDCPYPYKELSGCGVGFKLLQAFCQQNEINSLALFEYLDLLAVSIASDIVPLTGENRILAYFGLKKLNQSPRPGLAALVDLNKNKRHLTISGVVFGIGPRINAAGRMKHAGAAVDLLLAESFDEAEALASSIDHQNDERRTFDTHITEEALEMISNDKDQLMAKSTVLFKSDWHKGVIGIVASRCIERYYKPTIILTESNDMATGSARSVDGFDVYQAIAECADLLDQFGGHKYAAGITLPTKNVDAFRERFEEVVAKTITNEQTKPAIKADSVIFLDEINERFFKVISQMAPFGPKNMQPVFVSENVFASNVRLLKGEHLKFSVRQDDSSITFDAIGFGLGAYMDLVDCGMHFHMAYTIEENEYKGIRSLQLMIKDIKFD